MEDLPRDSSQKQIRLAIEARSNSVKQLCDLYKVVISIAVGLAFHSMVDPLARPLPIDWQRLTLFGALMITIIPFFHGAVRHLYATYIEVGGSTRVENWVVLIDYYLLFIEGGLFVALSTCLDSSRSFGVLFVGILILDVVWGVLSRVGFAGTQAQKAELSWARINALTVVILLAFLLAEKALLTWHLSEREFRLFLLLVATVRTGIDYYRNHSFYCPPYPTPNAETVSGDT
jgi:hypothetical protein